jgi:hypothetical protein
MALGFVCGLYGLDHPQTNWLPTALGLLVTGTAAQAYALYCGVKRTGLEPPRDPEDRPKR